MAEYLQQALAETVRRIVAVVQPERIVLFGSAARGTVDSGSDLDLLVVKQGAHRRRTAQAIYRALAGIGCSVDVVVVTPEDVAAHGETSGYVLAQALREGRTIYAA